ncbi:MAG: ACT domain-containing protein [Oscillospiraceae bacterium]|nr:ACT domain-containing protein [Oscillospiraceae bacterium]
MTLELLTTPLSVCKAAEIPAALFREELFFFAKTDHELSVVCPTSAVPQDIPAREDGWRAMRITGTLDFSLIGILAGISEVLAKAGVGIFVVSTFDTDYILVKEAQLAKAQAALIRAGYGFL